jgi:hypothetical protein
MHTIETARTPAQRRDAVLLSNAAGPVRRSLGFSARGITGTIKNKLNRPALEASVRDALAIAKVKKVRVSVVDTDYGTAIWVAPNNADQHWKCEHVMRQLGFTTPNAYHWLLTDDMKSEGFAL